MRTPICLTALFLTVQSISAQAAPPVSADSRLQIEGRVAFTEGPAWHPSGNVYFSDIANNRIMRRDRAGVIHTYRTESGRTNGLAFDHQGRLICCEGGGAESNRRVTRIELDGTITVLAESYQGKRFNSPNDCTIDSKGRIYFSDPRYRDRRSMEIFDDNDQKVEGVYRIDDVGKVERIITHEVDRPNGLAISPDEKFLFVADNVNDPKPLRDVQNRKLWRFDLNADGSVKPDSRKLLFDWETDRGPDGMAVDREGRLYVAAGFNFPSGSETVKKYKSGIYVISPEGDLLHFIPVPIDMITNCDFGGDDLKTLFITAGHKLWSIRVATPGHVAWLKGEAADPEFKTTSSGLKYRILRKSDGRKPTANDTVRCHYRGWLDDETEFDSSYKRGEPASFPLSGVITGWTEGLQLVGEGGKIELDIPYQLAYGEKGRPPIIPPKARLHFVIELISIR
jgi:gluconolactonase